MPSGVKATELYRAAGNSSYSVLPVLVSATCFTVYAVMGYTLTAAVAFPALALFNVLRFPLLMVPRQILRCARAGG